jgi:hypothetical protein
MLTPIMISLLCGTIGYIKPATGFGLFFLFNTGLGGGFEEIGLIDPKLGPFQAGNLAYATAIFSLLLRKASNPNNRIKPSLLLFLLLVFTGLALFSRSMELGTIFTTKIIWEIFYCLLWAPLFMALQKMDRVELYLCRRFLIFMSGITALIAILITMTGSQYLYDLFATRSEDLMQKDFIQGRIIVHGLWTFMPLGLWFCLMELFKEQKGRKGNTFLYGPMAMVVILAIAINLTRFMLLALLSGIAFILIAAFFILPRHISRKIYKFTGVLIIFLIIVILGSEGIYSGWMGRYQEARLPWWQQGRIIRNEYVFTRLVNELPLLGNKDYWSEEARISLITGDPHTFLNIWTSYGLIASLTFAVIMAVVFVSLVKIFILRKRCTGEVIYEWLFLFAFYIQLHWLMVSGDYLYEVTVFILILFLAEVNRLGSAMKHGNFTGTLRLRDWGMRVNL